MANEIDSNPEPPEQELIIKRVFDAQRELVFEGSPWGSAGLARNRRPSRRTFGRGLSTRRWRGKVASTGPGREMIG
jgi:hypothetical protein